jgi:type II secretory pathway component PulF
MARACRRVSQRLAAGQTLSACLTQSIQFDRSLVALVAWGERHGALAEALRISTEVFDDRIEQHASLIQRLLPPVTLIVVGTMIFVVIIGLMVPLVKLIEALSM